MALIVDSVSFSYVRGSQRPISALSDISLTLKPGQFTLVVGPTGSGKSTLMRLCAGLLMPSSGTVSVDGVTSGTWRSKRPVGLVFQDPESQLFADTVLEDVAFGPRNLGLERTAAESVAARAMDAVQLPVHAFGARSPFSLSGGEARRAAIAGVIAMEPDFLLADEPTAGLDASGRRAVCSLLLAQRARAGVMVVSHAAEQFLAYADTLLVLDAGRVRWLGSAAEAIAEPHVLAACGVRLPDVLEVQRLVSAGGLGLHGYSLDPVIAAEAIVAAGKGG